MFGMQRKKGKLFIEVDDNVEFRIGGAKELLDYLEEWLKTGIILVQDVEHYTVVCGTSTYGIDQVEKHKSFTLEKMIDLWYGNADYEVTKGTKNQIDWRVKYGSGEWSKWYTSFKNHKIVDRGMNNYKYHKGVK